MSRRSATKWAATVFLTIFFSWTFGQVGWAQYPNRPITLLVGYPAGGITDFMLRPLCQPASQILGQPIVFVNKPGAGTAVSLVSIKEAKPDGYTIGYLTGSGVLMPHLRNLPYDVSKDFTPIIKYMEYTLFGMVVRADSPWLTLKDLIDYSKANPGKIKYATSGTGTVHHLAMESFAKEAGIRWTHIPGKQGSDAITLLLGGHVDMAAAAGDFRPHVEAGKLRLLAHHVRKRSSAFPNVPTLIEMGYKTYTTSFGGIIGPKGLPEPMTNKLHGAFKEAMNDSDFRKALKSVDMEVAYSDPAGFGKEIHEVNDLFAGFVSELGLKKE